MHTYRSALLLILFFIAVSLLHHYARRPPIITTVITFTPDPLSVYHPLRDEHLFPLLNASRISAAVERIAAGDRSHKIFYYHMSKNAGWQLCALARLNKESMSKVQGASCDRLTRDKEHAHDGLDKVMTGPTCGSYEAAAMQANRTFFSNEVGFNMRLNCTFSVASRILTAIAIRHPVSHAASVYVFLHRQHTDQLDLRNPKPARYYYEETKYPVHDFLLPSWQTVRILNYKLQHSMDYTASLTPDDASLAAELLTAVDIVFPVERLCETVAVFSKVFGWPVEKSRQALLSYEHNSGGNNASMISFEPAAWSRIEESHWADMRLWKYANERLDKLLVELGINITTGDCPEPRYTYIPYDTVPESWKEHGHK